MVPARPDRYEAAAVPNGSCPPAVAWDREVGVAREERAGEKGTEAEAVTFRRSAGEPLLAPIAELRASGCPPEPAALRPATVPPAITAQAPSIMSTARMGALGGLDPEAECLPLTPEIDVLTTIRSRAWPVTLLAGPGEGLTRGADLLERLGPSVVSPLLAGE